MERYLIIFICLIGATFAGAVGGAVYAKFGPAEDGGNRPGSHRQCGVTANRGEDLKPGKGIPERRVD